MRQIRRLIGEGAGKSRSGGLEGLEREGKEPRNPEKEGDTERTGPKSGWEVVRRRCDMVKGSWVMQGVHG